MRKPLIVGNWKMNKTVTESIALVRDLLELINDYDEAEVVICPPFTSLWVVRELVQDTNIGLGAQNIYFQNDGAFTGEISAKMLQNIGCDYVILGHSERREYFQESSQIVAKKVSQAIRFGIKPIICVGERLSERESEKTKEVIKEELEPIFTAINVQFASNIIIAYEPIWAIGTGKSATSHDANETIKYIRTLLEREYNTAVSQQIKILYGGSVNGENIKSLMTESDIDGALVGGASLKAESFTKLIKFKD
jgi:triosephosphate isomerase